MIYTLIIGLIIIMMSSYVFMLEIKKKTYILSLKNNITEKSYNRETTEYLFSEMNKYVLSQNIDINRYELYKLFSSNPNKNKIGNEDYFIYYDLITDNFVVKQNYRNRQIKRDIYTYDFVDGKINYMYSYSKYN
ncbi:hypothetical protein CPAST_c18850 [Clostridium pasteurianum DSM 525 = ATCC 6013]|uniref:Uncharacterized protein n=1 Tax=Clostridium pasteurianum DSM 525 = ATCC 6013 TaxID=1262449 RepID=A0A0H3J9T2_CLOPA|nr:hypothetical protein [Clostridium pasteurianum]AJA47955.1 hypothetical protein CPAST_c18850 [Clostridium pasteurianum DSM 525 = ATCC 6013]AJA51943.1 hypothetical protein CLPA_c18850 [Clostridium pasteurianum DSM 525 = ATCC 6013]KRU12048.1 hypothetical protein CP6013_01295 [Clostridium pasteurianum DSM 525 = ATCC 6013]UZW16127.1 hypothetical protein OSC52_10010 [Clostridium pasteurianum]